MLEDFQKASKRAEIKAKAEKRDKKVKPRKQVKEEKPEPPMMPPAFVIAHELYDALPIH